MEYNGKDVHARFRLDGAVAAVTGAAQGIGLATARLLQEAGARVVMMDRNEAVLRDAAAAAGADFQVVDVTDESAVDEAFARIATDHRRLDVLVNNAGIAIRRPAVELAREHWDQVVAVNMTGMFLCARSAARHMIARGSGAIVNTASIMGLSGGGIYPNISYQATKGAVVNMTRALALEWAASGLRVNAVAPTYVDTPFVAALTENAELLARIKAMTPLGRLAEPEEVACAICFLASPAASMVTGHILAVDGGFLAQ